MPKAESASLDLGNLAKDVDSGDQEKLKFELDGTLPEGFKATLDGPDPEGHRRLRQGRRLEGQHPAEGHRRPLRAGQGHA